MKHNVAEIVALQPDYLGFIFHKKSPRHFEGALPVVAKPIKKVGVFVDASPEFVASKVIIYGLDVIQLHGGESPEYMENLRAHLGQTKEIWKVFSVGNDFDFHKLKPYEQLANKFLFDTLGKERGGNGVPFNWDLLVSYPYKKPFILSGGISLKVIPKLKQWIQSSGLPIHAIDVNSQFEIEPGLKNTQTLKQLIDELSS
ncbi:MAG: phosphoribosylanthranilate isomerase [Flavobacteriaceae bacterium]